jgi:transcriptional regulator with XRE-family HTH domain
MQHEMGRYEAVKQLSKRLNVTEATLYRWERGGDHFICDEKDLQVETVFKLVKCIEK